MEYGNIFQIQQLVQFSDFYIKFQSVLYFNDNV